MFRFPGEKAARVVPYVPFVISWLRHKEARVTDVMLRESRRVPDEEVVAMWNDFIEAQDIYGDLTTAQLRQLCASYNVPTLTRGVNLIFLIPEYRIVPDNVLGGLFAAMNLAGGNNGAVIANKLAFELDKLRVSHLELLAEFAALVRDTSSDPRMAAGSLGPSIFLSQPYAPADVPHASRLLQAMVDHGEVVFGKPAARSNFDPLGVRSPRYNDDERAAADAESQVSGRSRQVRPAKLKDALTDAGFM